MLKCLTDIIPGEFKEGYMDVVCLRVASKTAICEQLPIEDVLISVFRLSI